MTDISRIREVECENCGMVFLMRKAVVLDASGAYKYFCERDCAMQWKSSAKIDAREVPVEDLPEFG